MRAILIAALALLLASTVSAKQYYAVQSQDDVKNLRWQNCSQVIHGRLGDLHKYGDSQWHMVRQSADYFFSYSPCNPQSFDALTEVGTGGLSLGWESVAFDSVRPVENSLYYWLLIKKVRNQWGYTLYASFQDSKVPADEFTKIQKYVEFHMPEQKGDVPHFTGTYKQPISKKGEKFSNSVPHLASSVLVTVSCGDDDSEFSVNATHDQAPSLISFQSGEACARFPYTNKAMPTGGVVALVVVIVAFVIQFSICGWYHATHKLDINPAERQYDTME